MRDTSPLRLSALNRGAIVMSGMALMLCFAAVSSAFAQSPPTGVLLNTPVALSIEPRVVTALLEDQISKAQYKGQANFEIPGKEVTDPFSIRVSPSNVQLNYAFLPPERQAGTNFWAIRSREIGGTLTIGHIDASQVIERIIDGIRIVVRVDATCDNVRFRLPSEAASADALTEIAIQGGRINASLRDFHANWTPGSWVPESVECDGPDGFRELVTAEISRQLWDIDPYLGMMRQQIEANLASLSENALHFELSAPAGSALSVTAQFTPEFSADRADGGLIVTGRANLSYPGLDSEMDSNLEIPCGGRVADAPGLATEAAALGSEVVLPATTSQKLLTCAHELGVVDFKVMGVDVPGFNDLRNASFSRWMVWPDLGSFKSLEKNGGDFKFRIMSWQEPWTGNLRIPASGRGLLFDSYVPLAINIKAPKDRGASLGWDPYVSVFGSITGLLEITLNNGIVHFASANPQATFFASWDSAYVARYKPNERLDTGRIGKVVVEQFQKNGINVAVPEFVIGASNGAESGAGTGTEGKALRMIFSDLRLGGQNLHIKLAPQSSTPTPGTPSSINSTANKK